MLLFSPHPSSLKLLSSFLSYHKHKISLDANVAENSSGEGKNIYANEKKNKHRTLKIYSLNTCICVRCKNIEHKKSIICMFSM